MMRAVWNAMVADWSRKLSALFWAVFLLQYVRWLSKQEYNGVYWLDETVTIVYASLAAAAFADIALNARRVVRLLLQFAAAAVISVTVLDFRIESAADGEVGLWALVLQHWDQLTPFVWFGLGTVAVYAAISGWANTKPKITAAVIFSVVVFSVVDSFSRTFYFWDEVGYLIGCGLMLLVIRHFSEFRANHPGSWNYLKEYPGKVAFPVLIILSSIALSGMIAPNMRPLLEDPYTIWKQWRGEPVGSFGKGFAGMTVSGQGSSESGYRRYEAVLGGGFNYDYSPVFRVNTTHRTYYRGEVRSVYNGLGWEPAPNEGGFRRGSEMSVIPLQPDQQLEPDAALLDFSLLKTETVEQTFTLLNETSYPVLFGAYAIAQVPSIGSEDDDAYRRAFWSPLQQEVRWMERNGEYPGAYTVVSQVPVIDQEQLRQASGDMPEPLKSQYLQLPSSVPDRVRELAEEVTREADNTYDKMKLLEQFLRTEYAYNNQPDLSKAVGEDFVDNFLFEIREGYCDYFSTAMVVMARTLGVPARWVKGFAPGSYIMDIPGILPEEFLLDPKGAGTYTVRNADAHSWVEVYFHGYGWIPFEPTATFSMPEIVPEAEADASESVTDVPETAAPEETAQAETGRNRLWPVLLSVAVFVAAGLALLWLARRKGWLRFSAAGARGKDESEIRRRIVREFEKFLKYAKRRGFSRGEHETVREMAARWLSRGTWFRSDLETLIDVFEKAKYSGSELRQGDLETAVQAIERLRAALK
jgi:transglutaminase-like putative cysteine protease